MIGWNIWDVMELFIKDDVSAYLDSSADWIPESVGLLGGRIPNKITFEAFGIQLPSLSFRDMDVGYGPKDPQVRHVRFLMMPHLEWSYR